MYEYDLAPLYEIPTRKNVAMHGHTPPNRCCHGSLDSIAHELARNDVRIYAPHDYYCYETYPRLKELIRMRAGAYMVNAAEVIASSPDQMTFNDFEPQRIYTCIVGAPSLTEMSSKAEEIFEQIRHEDQARMQAMYHLANNDLDDLGVHLDYNQSCAAILGEFGIGDTGTFVMQERQMAQRIIETCNRSDENIEDLVLEMTGQTIEPGDLLAAEDVIRSAMMKQDKPWHVQLAPISLEQVYQAAWDLGALLFYPRLGDAKPHIWTDLEKNDDSFIRWLLNNHFSGVELVLSRNSSAEITRIVPKIREAGLLVIPGEEQNTGRTSSILPQPRDSDLPLNIKQAFWVDSLVCVAHQELADIGKYGWLYQHQDKEDLRNELARIGAHVLEQTYWEK